MAVHARLGGRDVGERRFFYGRVAIPAVDSHSADMMRVAELDWLFDVHALIGVVARPVEHGEGGAEAADDEQDCEDAEPRVDVRIAVKKLTHRVGVRALPPNL
jgi:hypothetical protein